ncbi:MAG: type II secretion system F family protein [Blastocatellia bacterium]|nr:type II secretion system F family protein [Blastocatellia bacterium]
MLYLTIVLFCLCLTYGIFLIVTRKKAESRVQMKQRLEQVLSYTANTTDPEVRLKRDELMSEIPMLHQWLLNLPTANKLKLLIDQADLNLTVMKLFLFSGAAGVFGALAASMLTPMLAMILILGTISACVPFAYVLFKRKERLNKFLADLPEALELMSRALAAGHAFTESLKMIAEEMAEPIATEFRRTYEEHNLGLSTKIALENLAVRVPLVDLRICVTAIMIQRETGGNLGEILEKVAHTIRDRFRIIEDLKTLTTQSRISAWLLCAVPAFIAVSATMVNPEYMSVLWDDPRGHTLLAIAVTLQTLGMVWVRKILQIKI